MGLNEEVKPIAKAPILKDPPKWVLELCEESKPLPRKELNQQEIEAVIGSADDKIHDCAARHAILIRYYKARDRALRATQMPEQAGK